MRNKVISVAYQNYGGRWYNRGEEIETLTEQDAEDMVVLNRATWAEQKEVKPAKSYKRRDMRSEH
jgi:uncharacterized protein (DUF1330 family)